MAALALALLAVGLVVDSGADDSFDAPKRLWCLVLIAVAAAAFAFPRFRDSLSPGKDRLARIAWLLAAAFFAAAALSAFFSPRRLPAWSSARTLLLYGLLLPLGASRTLARGKTVLLASFLAVAAVNAGVSILQARHLYQPFKLQAFGARASSGAFVGNVGYLALMLALAAVASLSVLLTARRNALRVAAGIGLLLFVVSLFLNRNLTALSAVLVGATLCLFARFGKKALPYAAAVLLLAALLVPISPMRMRVKQVWASARGRNWNAVTTYRFGAWKAAVAMARDRPLLGYGPGTFGAEFVPHRLAAEIAARKRYVNPQLTSSYAEAHCDYLQPFAELGIPAGLAALGAAGLLFAMLAARMRRPGPWRGEAGFLLGFLGAGAAGALTWFPLQRPVTALPLLLAAGRAWRISSSDHASAADSVEPRPRSAPLRIALGVAWVLLLAGAVSPEFSRYAAERALRQATFGLRFVLTRTSEVADPPQALSQIAERARGAAKALPGDPRPWILAGGAHLVKGEPDRALDLYRRALADGERSEIDLNIGRAYEGLGQTEKAHEAFLRALWVSPAMRTALPPDVREGFRLELKGLRQELKAGRLKAPPNLPE